MFHLGGSGGPCSHLTASPCMTTSPVRLPLHLLTLLPAVLFLTLILRPACWTVIPPPGRVLRHSGLLPPASQSVLCSQRTHLANGSVTLEFFFLRWK